MDQSASPPAERDAGAPRRSGRVVKAPTKFAPEPSAQLSAAKRKRGEGEDEGDDAENGLSDPDQDDESVDSDSPSDEDHPAPRARKPSQNSRAKKPSSKKARTNGVQPPSLGRAHLIPSRPKKAVRIEAGERGTGLFGTLSCCSPAPLLADNPNSAAAEIFGSGEALQSVARQWLDKYRESDAQAMATLVNCILRCAGCDQEVTTDDVGDPENIPGRLVDLQNVYQEVCPLPSAHDPGVHS